MRKPLLMLTAVSMLFAASCSKTKDEPTPDQTKNLVTINGSDYSTVVIGTQTWTTVNYNGSGGVNYNDGANDPTMGKLYSFHEVKGITGLPTGWRIPTEADVEKLMTHLGTEKDQVEQYLFLNEAKSKKLISNSGWNPSSLNGSNETGLNIKPTGYSFSAPTVKWEGKGVVGSFWTSTRDNNGNALFLEVSCANWDKPNTPSLRAYIGGTTLDGDPSHSNFFEKRSIRFVKNN